MRIWPDSDNARHDRRVHCTATRLTTKPVGNLRLKLIAAGAAPSGFTLSIFLINSDDLWNKIRVPDGCLTVAHWNGIFMHVFAISAMT